MRRVGITNPVEESVGVEWCDVTFDLISGVSIKVSGVDVGNFFLDVLVHLNLDSLFQPIQTSNVHWRV